MTKRSGLSWLLVILWILLAAGAAKAQWIKDGVLVCGADSYQNMPRIITDESGGAIIVWMDQRDSGEYDLYGNRVDANGYVLGGWGLPLAVAPGYQYQHRLIPDGTGGTIVVWADSRAMGGHYDIYAQRVDGEGNIYWPENGLAVCTAPMTQDAPQVVPDLLGGAIFMWSDYRLGNYDIYAQRVASPGDTLWPADGIPIDTSIGDQYLYDAAPDGTGGAFVVYTDTRSGDSDIYAQRFDVNGNLLWGTGGVAVCAEPGWPSDPHLVATPDTGICVTWIDYRSGMADVYVQKVDKNGQTVWQTGGLQVCPAYWNKYSARLVSDGSGGAIVVWYDERSYYETYAQRVASDGTAAWSEYGVIVFNGSGDGDPGIMADGAGGAFVVLDVYWDEEMPNDVYLQRLDHDGNMLWGPKGAAVCTPAREQYEPVLAPDGRGGAIVAWTDYRSDDDYSDIYCQRIGPSGLWGDPEPAIVWCDDVPDDQGGWVRIRTRASALDRGGEDPAIFGYNVWRLMGGGGPMALSTASGTAPAGAPAPRELPADRAAAAAILSDPATAIGVRVSGAQVAALGLPEGEWESVGFWFAMRDTVYNIAVPTRDDYTESNTPWETFIVTAHTTTAGIYVASEPADGYSIDNLAPGTTMEFAGNETADPAGLMLSWSPNPASDLWKYDIYRGDEEAFVPGESNLLGSTAGTTLHDRSWVKAYQYFYKLVAVDRHGNLSPAALLRPEDINVGVLLKSFMAVLRQSAIEVTWTLAEIDEGTELVASRSTGGDFVELPAAAIEHEGLSFSLVDRNIEPGTTYRYQVSAIDARGSRVLFETDGITTPEMPLALHQNHPNPFNPSTTITYYLPAAAAVTLDVYDTAGRLVTRFFNQENQERGTHSVEWRGVDAQGRAVSSGVYFYRIRCGKDIIARKMILLR
jgi:hypothetical protein